MTTDLLHELSALGADVDRLAPAVSPDEVRMRAVPGPVGLSEPARRSRWPRRAALAVGVAASFAAVAIVVRDDSDQRLRPSTSLVPQPTPVPTPVPTQAPVPPIVDSVQRGDSGPVVLSVEEALAELGHEPGEIDGVFDAATEQAVWAFEALSLGRRWQDQTGMLDAQEIALLVDGEADAPQPQRTGAGVHVEIDLVGQTVMVVRAGVVVFIAHASTGSGEQWCTTRVVDVDIGGRPMAPTRSRSCGKGVTPGGVYGVSRMVDGDATSVVGTMRDPVFFNYFIAVHGADHVPREPVSHGAVRIPMDRIEEFVSLVSVGDTVYVFDGVDDPEELGDRLPIFPWLDPDFME